MDSSKKDSSAQRKFVGRKDKERLKQFKKMQLQQEKVKRLKQQAEFQLSRLKSTGLVNAYQNFLRSLCTDGLPEQSILYQKAAQYIIQYQKKLKKKSQRKQSIETYNSEILRKSRASRSMSPVNDEISTISIPKKKKNK